MFGEQAVFLLRRADEAEKDPKTRRHRSLVRTERR
jgi:hypothetical protein